ncbi:carbohydrate ABC transporter substrate-binding protein (CUT1 family) [Halanaerobium saccharolyticum]|jgi:multiple sugar transport system substrate-binding protein|uniref:Carbohydrate ABC transporter substrate-binding protein (CUT1 family) n=1 Tax=Halanaerobium saccharolyticum TaxID=43595 RepID=A0A2T5RQD5_9FIRM|nr:ABC transporter substrate-binding protein [Halanaerobium saccharolyticum]PTW02190.1 carbohydrate ABC transporter substrate-binding protein (CUT1 family) [Halanaerobium saccharolyticum]
MKKALFLVVLVAVMVGLTSNVMAETVTVEYWNLFGGGDAEFMDEIVAEFNASHEDIEVDVTRLEWGEYYTKLKTATASGNGPDIAISHVTRVKELADEGLIVPLDELGENVGIDWTEYNTNILSGAEINGEIFAVPFDTHPLVYYYNKDLLAEADLLAEDGTPKMEGSFKDFLEKLKSDSSAKYPMTNWTKLTEEGHYRVWWSLYSQLDGSPVISGDEVTLDKAKAVEAINYMKDLYDKEYSPLHSEYMENVNLFRNGEAASLLTGVWITGTLEATEDLNFGVVPMPQIFDNRSVWADSHTLVIPYSRNVDQEKREAALTFAKWATDNGHLWAVAGHIPSKDTIKEKEEFVNMPYRMDYVKAADYVSFDSAGSYTWSIRTEITTALSKVWNNQITAEEAVDQAVTGIERLLSR